MRVKPKARAYERSARLSVAAFGDGAQVFLATRRTLIGHQPHAGTELRTALELLAVAPLGHGGQDTDGIPPEQECRP